MFHRAECQKGNFLEQTKAAREERALEKRKDEAAIKIQALVRGWLVKKKFTNRIISEYDEFIPEIHEDGSQKVAYKSAVQVYHVSYRFMMVWNAERDSERLVKLCRYLVASLEHNSPKFSYVGVALNKDYVLRWISHMNNILWKCCECLEELRPEYPSDMKTILVFLHTLVSYTSSNTWVVLKNKNMEKLGPGMNQLCANLMGNLFHRRFYIILKSLLLKGLGRNKITFKNVSLTAILTLSLRPLISANFSDKLMTMFLIHILSVPGLIQHLNTLAPEVVTTLSSHNIFAKSLELLSSQQSMRIVFNTLEGNYALCLMANLLQLGSICKDSMLAELSFPTFTVVMTGLLESCQNYVVNKQSNLTHWHPVLGWFAQPMDPALHAAMPHVKVQLHILWSSQIISILLGDFLSGMVKGVEAPKASTSPSHNSTANFLKKALESRSNKTNSIKTYRTLGSPDVHRVVLICSMYHTALNTLNQLKLDILTGLCYQGGVLYNLWLFLCSLGPNCGLKTFLDHLAFNTKCTAPEFQMLQLIADCMTHYVTILDDMEMYEHQDPFKINDFIVMSNFLNVFLHKAVLGNLFDLKTIQSNTLVQSLHTLLMALYRRDCRRNYAPQGHWLLKDVRISAFMMDLEKGKRAPQLLLQTMPHIIPHEDRVRLFRKYITNEKTVLGLTESACASPQSTLITVHRSRIVEDGYRQLAMLPPQALKGVIRVRFINEQGLDEAGIDQDGVFKEFLEESIKRVFDPFLNLFKATSEERLYPSPTSYMQDNHLQLFEFVGRMLGKAVYEGIVVDVPFASFFLSQVLGQTAQALYSCVDELPSLDAEVYRSLSYVKHYKGDVSELDLTFSIDENNMGRLVTHELIPGGKAIPVTNENKINYIHLVAHFRMHVQIKDQTSAFIRGFRSIINPDWLSMFSTPELQRLISGDNVPLDLRDLRKNTQYYGGFHDSHRVIGWLWDILDKDFTEDEKAMFLKFVTSCSKPPLLGFAHLEPPFSIRCVEVGDDEDTGDTIGSVIRGFFTIRKRDPLNRLPTSSTCFNLLKLPNYQKKSTLREKLRYAVTCNTGFELS
ncbi:PREDICTED: ubiquitin-protein ligase E3B [Nicrophorus vespilloides]|uniref:HECT-type E3 ubiquitin transferase n=1 Tax=Nicrophorus vespilloides TaxID=110193 RepID=A0ABM1M465_NICVS|nr:PREDICTED: ubiquitin-protein ligase E3B [Nicrophorus vespilloides]